MWVNEITHKRVSCNTLKVTNTLGKVCVICEGLHHLQSCVIRSLAAHLAKLRGTSAGHVPSLAIEWAVTQVWVFQPSHKQQEDRVLDIQSLAPKTVPRLSMPAATRPSFLAICHFRHKGFKSEKRRFQKAIQGYSILERTCKKQWNIKEARFHFLIKEKRAAPFITSLLRRSEYPQGVGVLWKARYTE